ncbi:MAG TPA: hypothetical protein VFV03_01260 [Solirubrobacteraceae bacterium]|nr:hypothetical protein [Solirubrobacteraceae bacterium]
MSTMVKIPAAVVGYLRESACGELDDASDAFTKTIRVGSPTPQPFIEHRGYFNAVCALLDELGWLPTEPPADIEINLGEHQTVLLTVTREAREAAEHAYKEIEKVKDPGKRQQLTERTHALRNFTLTVETQARRLSYDPGPTRVRTVEDLGAAINACLKEYELTAEEMAEVSTIDPVDPDAIRALEHGESKITLKQTLRLLNMLGLNVDLSRRQPTPAQTRRHRTPPLLLRAWIQPPLRSGLITVLAIAAQGISANAAFPDREQHPDWYSDPRRNLEAACAVLDVIGWADTEQGTDIEIDLHEHHGALEEALESVLRTAESDLNEADTVDAERIAEGQAPQKQATVERVQALREYAASAKAQIQALKASQR